MSIKLNYIIITFEKLTPTAYGSFGQYLKGVKINLILSNNCVPDNDTIPKYKNTPNKTGIGINFNKNFAFRQRPLKSKFRFS